jgi:peptide/nickel transport system ATP-binding protein
MFSSGRGAVNWPLLEVEGLCVDRGAARVVDRVSFSMSSGEALGIVGASGAGKSTLARALLGLVRPKLGRIRWLGRDVAAMSGVELRAVHRDMQLVLQDPASSLDPRWTVAAIVAEPLIVHGLCQKRERAAEVVRLLRTVGLDPSLLERHPHQLSGGQAQRVALARALATAPSLLIADEALSACDVSLQAQMIDLFRRLRRSLRVACILITHDLRLAACLCDRILVLANGSVAEIAEPAVLLRHGSHPATRELVAAARAVPLDSA